ncbi:MAG TPA: acetyl-CoA carboxylase biotin carboxyl carrier protein subunit, partial [Dokdonella sp.]
LDIDAQRLGLHDGTRRHDFIHAPSFAYEASASASGDRIVAPMPGRIVLVKAEPGAEVAQGQELLVMEAMKMELALKSPRTGKVEAVQAAVGDFVDADAVLVRLVPGG